MAVARIGGIYEIVNIANGKRYIGSAVNFKNRWHEHRSLLRYGEHHSIHLQRAWDKHGESQFEFSEIELVADRAMLIEREQYYIDTARPEYNICQIAGSSLGVKHSEETRAKVGAASRAAWQDEIVRGKLMVARSVAWDDPDRRKKGQEASKRNWENPEYRSRVSASRSEREVTDEFRDAVKSGIAARKEKGLPFARQINPCFGRITSEETKEKLRQANLGKHASEETRRKMSVAHTGKTGAKRSDQTRANMKAAWERRKAAA